ncbi:MAG: nitroreductase [Clostridia bacterium]|nr:nitroreductase [Clostridia bacterium]
MTLLEAVYERHSVRKYKDEPVAKESAEALFALINKINAETGLDISLCLDEPGAFMANKPSYGSFSGCKNYIVMAAGKGRDEDIGYYGEELVLTAQTLGLNTCWVALTFEKSKVPVKLKEGEKIYDHIALGYGQSGGVPHKSKPLSRLYRSKTEVPDWFRRGMEAAVLAPTAINQQRFLITYDDGKVSAKALLGPCSKTDLGIVKYHFELGAGKNNFKWED